MTSADWQVVLRICIWGVLVLAPFAGLIRAARRLRQKRTSDTAPLAAAGIIAADAVAGLFAFFEAWIALVGVLLSVVWLVGALGVNLAVRQGQRRAVAGEPGTAAPGPFDRRDEVSSGHPDV